ncbi:glycosyltransferase family 2 protein [Paenibacillus hemerocallicola]|uniref:Glycosyltransferase family 2 protein n=1 Tax=Paenibacillus hemerocallicola TaxID=1172614 RepID=A0A5C4TCJ3_9BACL|nr:glycosyltransferase family 2 protein [Paenibacillus hemerocallicola]TNJ66207.1 glycosyltransferase family 2 protein [Paenibacillus hemerocallicola]
MITISLCMIVKNEEDTLPRCLSSVAGIADEIIIVDTGSTDRTESEAKKFTDLVYRFEWIDDFAAARNYAFSLATQAYILWLDADDVLKPDDRLKFLELKKRLDPSVDAVSMELILSEDRYGNVSARLRRNRLVKRERQFRWIGAVHEYLEVYGNILNGDIAVTHRSVRHDSDRNINIYEKRLAAGERFSPRDLYYYANELKDHGRLKEAAARYDEFLVGGLGWIEDNIAACGKLADCYHGLRDKKNELASALRSFEYGAPRAEFCCRLGYSFLQANDVRTAIFWYELAAGMKPASDGWGLSSPICSTWLPHLQLCVCYDRLGDFESAFRHNEAARGYNPDHPGILHNRNYLLHKLGGSTNSGGKE